MTTTADRPGTTVADALLADGRIVHLRSAAAADRDELAAMFQTSSADALRLRFFAVPGPAVVATEVARLTRPRSADHAALVAVEVGRIVGVASYECGPDPSAAEFAVFVAEDQRGRGVGTVLLEHLAALAKMNGVSELSGEVLPVNSSMLRVARDMAAHARTDDEAQVVDVDLPTGARAAAISAADQRHRTAERLSLRPLLAPRSVAVVGASRTGGVGHQTLRALAEYGFNGTLFAVNPHADSVAGVPSVKSLRKLPGLVDLAIIAVPAAVVPEALREAGESGVRAAIVLSSGFGEAGEHGQALQAEAVRVAREHSMRLLGPNCLGLLNTDRSVRLNATFAGAPPVPGGLGVASQSGAVGISLLDHLARSGCGVSSFVSLGNKADISGNDLLAYWYDDPATKAVALYLESFGNPRRFARIVRDLSRRKPVLAVKSGRSAAGQRAGASHTAAAAAPDVAVDSLFAQAGVIRCDDLGELIDAARMLVGQPLPAGNRIAVVGNAGGVNVLAVDAAEAVELAVPAVSPELAARLGPAGQNPLDLGAEATPQTLQAALTAFAESGEVDAIVVVAAATRANDVPGMLTAAGEVFDAHPDLPAAGVVVGRWDVSHVAACPERPAYDLPERAIRAIGHAARYAAWLREPLGGPPILDGVDAPAAEAAVAAAGEGWQPADVVADLLRCYGIPQIAQATAISEDAAVAAADELGYPVVVKAAVPDLVHKTDVGAVRLNLTDARAVRQAYQLIATALDTAQPPVLVQPMALGPVELAAGVVHDPLFGSLVMLGLGGVLTDLLDDRVYRLTPMSDRDGRLMWRSLRAARLLTGYRGAPGVDTAAVEELVHRLGRLAADLPQVAELDLNPVVAGPDGLVVVDAKLRLATVGDEPDPYLFRLR
ncbi:MAG: GNAT family N-acetyltransferase [Hamadaea sp.]|uniref:bifunctional acetate--CoA ligase family protein/GNAT family N-acetyltransferase n=1 Tax=Hamadaea sp. TaxID=2024425 RepID=UPI0017956349|nr:GNAT family N-acetyltransferase [Hamadaea sp.]NUR74445.1 GNAT family N-acetyltransferase [Hamadaea sp.]NUT18953.1 GNAT family N-acetyltransferase [Hamadaea sp.]